LLERALMRDDERGKGKGRGGDGAPFIGGAAGVGDVSRVVLHGGEVWGWWGQRGSMRSAPK
jgi:hypothetical protein